MAMQAAARGGAVGGGAPAGLGGGGAPRKPTLTFSQTLICRKPHPESFLVDDAAGSNAWQSGRRRSASGPAWRRCSSSGGATMRRYGGASPPLARSWRRSMRNGCACADSET